MSVAYRITLFSCYFHDRREGWSFAFASGELVEDVAECAREDTLDLRDLKECISA
jgi:hypothetical protein